MAVFMQMFKIYLNYLSSRIKRGNLYGKILSGYSGLLKMDIEHPLITGLQES